MPVTFVSLPYERPAAEFVAEGPGILCERVEKDAVYAQSNDLSAYILSSRRSDIQGVSYIT